MKLFLSVLSIAITTQSAFAVHALSPRMMPQALSSTRANAAPKKLLYYGGPVITNPQVYTVFWGKNVDPETIAAMPDLYSSALHSNYMNILKQYSTVGATVTGSTHASSAQTFGLGTYVQSIQIQPTAAVKGTIDDVQIQQEIERQIAAKVLPEPNANTLFMIHFPPGLKITNTDGTHVITSCKEFCAFHNGFVTQNKTNVYYGVMPDLSAVSCQGCSVDGTVLGGLTFSASHELMEALTDAFPTPGSNPAYPQAWNSDQGEESADVCGSFAGRLKAKSGKIYTIQQIWDNNKGSCTTGNYVAR